MLIFGAVVVLGLLVYAVDGPSSFLATVGMVAAIPLLCAAWQVISDE